MPGNVVGSASVVIEADLGDLARDLRRRFGDAVRPLADVAAKGVDQAGTAMEHAGGRAGGRAGAAIGRGIEGAHVDHAGRQVGERTGEGFSRGLRGRVNSGLSGLREKLSGQMGDLAKVAAGAFAVDKVGEFFGSAIDEATESQKVNAQTATVLKATGDAAGLSAGQVGDLATQISNKAGIDDEAIQAGENLLLNFKNVHNEAGKGNDVFSRATKIATDYSVATGSSLTGAMRTFGKALNDPVKGMGALSKAGVTLTDQQKAQVKAMVASGNTVGAQKLLLSQLEARYKGSAAAQATAGEKAQVAWGNFKEQIGGILLPIIAKASNFLTTTVVPALSSVVTWLQSNGSAVKTVVTAIAPLLVAWGAYNAYLKAGEMWTKAVGAAQKITAGISALFTGATEAQTVAAEEGTVAQEEMNVAMTANPIGLVVAAIAALAAGFYLAWQHSATFRRIVTGAFNAVKEGALFLWHHVMEPVGRGIATAFSVISDGARSAWRFIEKVYGWIKGGIHGVASVVSTVTDHIGGFFTGMGDVIHTVWDKTVGWVFGKMRGGIRAVRDVFRDVGAKIGGFFRAIGDVMQRVYDKTIGPIIDKITSAIDTIEGWFSSGPRTGMQNLGQIPTDYSGLGGLPSSGQLGALTPPKHAKGGNLTGIDIVGDAGPELLLGGRTVLSNPGTHGGNLDEFANRIANKLEHLGERPTIGTVELHYPKPDTIDQGLAAAMRAARTVLGR